ncbi:MAG: protein kinase [Rubrivivax sp.]|nr:protein kinase [Rubrivivax sp.]
MTLGPNQIGVLSRLLDEALPLDAQALQDWLDRLPPEHAQLVPALRRALLDDSTATRMAGPLATSNFATARLMRGQHESKPSSFRAGQRIGPYELVREIGAGGMAVVWLARRADGAFKRELALKLPFRSYMLRGLGQRFSQEIDILAALEHSNIARMYDAGTTSDGLPYLAMEYVQGETLEVWCDQRRLTVTERLAIFLQVLEAVSYAHARGVVHLDLKPSNILVSQSGHVRLLDFGISHLIDLEHERATEDGAGSVHLAKLGASARVPAPLTPRYASPEQMAGEAAGPRADIYSLGVVLHELLCGVQPGRVTPLEPPQAPGGAAALPRTSPPSTCVAAGAGEKRRVTDAQLRELLSGKLGAIIERALERTIEARYASATDLTADVRAVLEAHREPGVDARHLEPKAPLSILVLPFANHTGVESKGHIADALTASITADLTRIRDLYVVPAATALAYESRNLTLPALGLEAGVRFVLQGSVMSSGGRLRVAAQLADARTDSQLWNESFDGDHFNLLVLLDQITARVGNTIAPLMVIAAAPSKDGQAADASVADLLLRVRALEGQTQSFQRFAEVESIYRQVLQRDSANLSAMAGLAVNLAIHADWLEWTDPDQTRKLTEARDLAGAVKAVDPGNYRVHIPIAIYAQHVQDLEAARLVWESAVQLKPRHPSGYINLAVFHLDVGEPARAIPLLERSLELSPQGGAHVFAALGAANFALGNDDAAIHWFLKALDLNFENLTVFAKLAMAYANKGEMAKAARFADQYRWRAEALNAKGPRINKPKPGSPAAIVSYFYEKLLPNWERAGLP